MSKILGTQQSELEGTHVDCDAACPARAAVIVADVCSRLRLALCGHHYRRHGAVLGATGWDLVADTRGALVLAEQSRLVDQP